MGFLDTPSPNPRTQAYYDRCASWTMKLLQQHRELNKGKPTNFETERMLMDLFQTYVQKANTFKAQE